MKKRYVWLIVAVAVLLAVAVGVTFALLVASSNVVENTFTVGDVSITLEETSGTDYKLAPGVELVKDPTITVKAGSEICWLFVKVQKSSNFDNFCDFEMVNGWTALQGQNGVYYRKVEMSAVDQKFKVLKNDRVTVKEELTEEQLDAVGVNPTLKITAYAIQTDGISTANDAWQILNQ